MNVTLMFLDISKAYDNVGIPHLIQCIEKTDLPRNIKRLIINLNIDNRIQVQTSLGKTKPIHLKRGLLQGAPLSPLLYNLVTDHILAELAEESVSEAYGFKVVETLPAVSIMGFADDTVLVGSDSF